MPDILTDTEIAEITDLVDNVGVILLQGDTTMLLRSCNALLASHAALTAEVAALRAALKRAMAQWEGYADAPRDMDGGPYLADSNDPHDLEATIYRQCRDALTERTTDANS